MKEKNFDWKIECAGALSTLVICGLILIGCQEEKTKFGLQADGRPITGPGTAYAPEGEGK